MKKLKHRIAPCVVFKTCRAFAATLLAFWMTVGIAFADPCGMVPPASLPAGKQGIVRTGRQLTYAMYRDGIESLVIHPGFVGDVAQFGMLIPFPTPPAIRKVPDNTFEQLKALIDPPEVIVDLRRNKGYGGGIYGGGYGGGMGGGMGGMGGPSMRLQRDETRVISEEAVGMYDVAVLEAGSSEALKKWMDENNFRYPVGMDSVCEDYIADSWCFVAVRARVGHKTLVDPKPGQTNVDATLQDSTRFEGHVQAMGFRFRSQEFTIPMRLSTFNEGDLNNTVYAITDSPVAIRNLPKSFVRRQVAGRKLLENTTRDLPLRIYGGDVSGISEIQKAVLKGQRLPTEKIASAKQLLETDLFCLTNKRLSIRHEEISKELLNISHRLGLKGEAIDKLHEQAARQYEHGASDSIDLLEGMHLSIIEGEFPANVLASENLTFEKHSMPSGQNNSARYNARLHDQHSPKGVLHEGTLTMLLTGQPVYASAESSQQSDASVPAFAGVNNNSVNKVASQRILLSLLCGGIAAGAILRKRQAGFVAALLLAFVYSTSSGRADDANDGKVLRTIDTAKLIAMLNEPQQSERAAAELVRRGRKSAASLNKAILEGSMIQKGWSVICLKEIGGETAKHHLTMLAAVEDEPLVSNWITAARYSLAANARELFELAEDADLSSTRSVFEEQFRRLIARDSRRPPTAAILAALQRYPDYQQLLAAMLTSEPLEDLVDIMLTGSNDALRRNAASYAAAIGKERRDELVALMHARLEFKDGDRAPWHGGALFLPRIEWTGDTAARIYFDIAQWSYRFRENPLVVRQAGTALRDLNGSGKVIDLSLSPTGAGQNFGATGAGTRPIEALRVAEQFSLQESIRFARLTGLSIDPALSEAVVAGSEHAYAKNSRGSVALCWSIGASESGENASVASWGGDSLVVEEKDPKGVTLLSDAVAMRQLASFGKYSDLIVRINAPDGTYSSDPLIEYGYQDSSMLDGIAVEPGYWVYLYPTWYVWRENSGRAAAGSSPGGMF